MTQYLGVGFSCVEHIQYTARAANGEDPRERKVSRVGVSHKVIGAFLLGVLAVSTANAQEEVGEEGASARQLDTVYVTATKKKDVENVQDIPIAVSAFGDAQLKEINAQDITGIGARVPNAVIAEVGTYKGVASFSVRGQSSLSSIPSVEPKVGIFVDGIYYGSPAGAIFDTFDLESITVLRGPQGILFGRNVVGGAVVVNTKAPSDTFQAELTAKAESGFRGTGASYTTSGIITGPITGNLSGKLGVYYNKDDGWFKNKFDDSDYGKSETTVVRGALKFEPTSDLQFLLRLEHGDQSGDGAPAQSHENGDGVPGMDFSRDSFDMSFGYRGEQENKWSQAAFETNWDVGFGDGVITNIAGWREFEGAFCIDLDATPNDTFNSGVCLQDPVGAAPVLGPGGSLNQEQFSDELRYSGRFGDFVDVTAGLFYFNQEMVYTEARSLFGGSVRRAGGGVQDQTALGAFLNGDFDVTDDLMLTAGIRYSYEEKDIATTSQNSVKPGTSPAGFCSVQLGTCPVEFTDSKDWANVDYKLGAQYEFTDNFRAYASWSTAFRAGGYNVRTGAASEVPGPVDEEFVDNYEIGIKSEPTSWSLLNATVFFTETEGLQIPSLVPSEAGGVVQRVINAADVETVGIELDGQVLLTDALTITGSVGVLDAKYVKVLTDLNEDNIIDSADSDLKLVNVPEFNYAASVNYDIDLGSSGQIATSVSYTYQDMQFFAVNNKGYGDSFENLSFNAEWRPDESAGLSVGVYGKNLLNDVQFTSDTQLPASVGSSYATMQKGRVLGVKLQYDF